MAITEAPPVNPDAPPDVRGPTAPLPATILALGVAALIVVIAGVVFSQVNYALSDRVLTQNCIDLEISREDNGAIGVCNIVEALQDPVTSAGLYLGIGLGAVALGLGAGMYRRMDSKRRRDDAITGAVLGAQGILLALLILWFRSASPGLFTKHFLNFADLEGYGGAFVRAASKTLILAFGGELGGIVIGLVLGVLTLSSRRVVRAPARIYINFFRGTPLIWQLVTGYFALLFGFGIQAGIATSAWANWGIFAERSSMFLISLSFRSFWVIRVGGTITLLPGSSPAISMASALTETWPTTAGFVAAVAAQALSASRMAAISGVEMSAE